MAKDTKTPKYVNMQKSPTMVPGADGRMIRIHPFDRREEAQDGATYVVEGEHFGQFCGPMGPLYPFPVKALKAAEDKAKVIAEQATAAAAEVAGVASDAGEDGGKGKKAKKGKKVKPKPKP
jgi:hypothetical protein